MSFREEDRQKIGCPSRGFGLAAAAIGVGVGAALYYFFSKRPENPHGEGSTDPGWRSEPLDGQRNSCNVSPIMEVESDEYTTISENMTSDTSIHVEDSYDDVSNSSVSSNRSNETDNVVNNSDYSYVEETEMSISYTDQNITCNEQIDMSTTYFSSAGYVTDLGTGSSDYSYVEETGISFSHTGHSITCNELRDTSTRHFSSAGYVTETATDSSSRSESDMSEWDLTSESEDVPEYTDTSSVMDHVLALLRSRCRRGQRNSYDEGGDSEREQLHTYRDRPWTSEECSICFELITLNQEVMALPCTHRFHQACILPWLQEKETCPNCRRRAE